MSDIFTTPKGMKDRPIREQAETNWNEMYEWVREKWVRRAKLAKVYYYIEKGVKKYEPVPTDLEWEDLNYCDRRALMKYYRKATNQPAKGQKPKPYATLSDPTKADFKLKCCGIYTTYGSSVEHTLSQEGGYIECRKCRKKYKPSIKVTLKEMK